MTDPLTDQQPPEPTIGERRDRQDFQIDVSRMLQRLTSKKDRDIFDTVSAGAAMAVLTLTIPKAEVYLAELMRDAALMYIKPRPIHTAPRDGTLLLLRTSDFGWVEGFWDDTVEPYYDNVNREHAPAATKGDWCAYILGIREDEPDLRLYCGASPTHWLPKPPAPVYTGECDSCGEDSDKLREGRREWAFMKLCPRCMKAAHPSIKLDPLASEEWT